MNSNYHQSAPVAQFIFSCWIKIIDQEFCEIWDQCRALKSSYSTGGISATTLSSFSLALIQQWKHWREKKFS
jgi:hypothetical protein